ncbi:hypothetical protein DFH11DRAFT_1504104 [Phellopilus nigrolimitatus]|nr:hypothetical protein DFH11DRAFT_1504104 [Phellopilus nigrolimitatus]
MTVLILLNSACATETDGVFGERYRELAHVTRNPAKSHHRELAACLPIRLGGPWLDRYDNCLSIYLVNELTIFFKLSEESKVHEERSREYNALAAAEIFAFYNHKGSSSLENFSRCDLHGLHVDEAMKYAQNHLITCRNAGVDKTMLIVGEGSQSQAGGARIKPAIMQMVTGARGVIACVDEKDEGCIVVELTRGHTC